MLRPPETLQKLLFSTPAHFVAEFETSDFVLTHAWPVDPRAHDPRSPLHRSYFALAFTSQPVDKAPGVVIPDYSPTGDIFCAMMAVLFGKRFDHHGPIEMTGHYHVPDLERSGDLCDPLRPYHGASLRADYPVALDLRELKRFLRLLEDEAENVALAEAFTTASLFYARALRAVGRDPEVAFLHLITACERLAEVTPLQSIEPEAEIRTALDRIAADLEGGDRIAGLLRSRMRQLKRRFTALITCQLDEGFFARSEAEEQWERLRAVDFPRGAAAAYDLRSRYVHTGAQFGSWIKPNRGNGERQLGSPVLSDRTMARLLARAPTFIGLERVTRYVLMKTAAALGADLPPARGERPLAEAGAEGESRGYE